MAYLGEICSHCKGTGYIRQGPNCGSTEVETVEVPGLWWEWRCEKCGWKYRRRYGFAHSKDNM